MCFGTPFVALMTAASVLSGRQLVGSENWFGTPEYWLAQCKYLRVLQADQRLFSSSSLVGPWMVPFNRLCVPNLRWGAFLAKTWLIDHHIYPWASRLKVREISMRRALTKQRVSGLRLVGVRPIYGTPKDSVYTCNSRLFGLQLFEPKEGGFPT